MLLKIISGFSQYYKPSGQPWPNIFLVTLLAYWMVTDQLLSVSVSKYLNSGRDTKYGLSHWNLQSVILIENHLEFLALAAD